MTNISTERLFNVIKWNFISQKQTTIRFGLSICGVLLALSLLNSGMIWNHEEMTYVRLASLASMYSFVFFFCVIRSGATINFNMKTKNDVLNYLMLPATKMEKYLGNIFQQGIVFIAVTIIAMLAADLLQMLLSWILCGNGISIIFGGDAVIPLGKDDMFSGVFDIIASLILVHSTFTLGGTFYRKHTVLLTVLTVTFIPIIIGTVGSIASVLFVKWVQENGYTLSIEWLLTKEQSEIAAHCVIIAWSLINYTLAYHFFKRTQVINNKFHN